MNRPQTKKTRWTTAFFHLVLFIGLGYMQALLSMTPFKDQPSSNLSYAFYTDVFWAVTLTSVPYFLLQLLLHRVQPHKLQFTLHLFLVGLLWFWINWGVFLDREAGWSTYTTVESLCATLRCSAWLGVGLVAFGWGSWRVNHHRSKEKVEQK
ncbi:hypothetical protein [Myroides sp. DF42-4-2]|uniref:hypothetical protein n=2 Tax=unclassified Myroides TaxID=2642485 RepID=UPI002575FE15|nr:hypothetical protein [Myroides sp. DF42-4-2]MDM1408071.1 hypothetical protein [Myroides sp. DF42-4-2]